MARLLTTDGEQINLFLNLDSHDLGKGGTHLFYGPKTKKKMDFIVSGFKDFKTNTEFNNKNKLVFYKGTEEHEVLIANLMNTSESSPYEQITYVDIYFDGDDLVFKVHNSLFGKITRIDLFKSASTNEDGFAKTSDVYTKTEVDTKISSSGSNIVMIAASGTWTKPAGVTQLEITLVGGGSAGWFSSGGVSIEDIGVCHGGYTSITFDTGDTVKVEGGICRLHGYYFSVDDKINEIPNGLGGQSVYIPDLVQIQSFDDLNSNIVPYTMGFAQTPMGGGYAGGLNGLAGYGSRWPPRSLGYYDPELWQNTRDFVHADDRGTGGGGTFSKFEGFETEDIAIPGGNGGTMSGLAQLGGNGRSGTHTYNQSNMSIVPYRTFPYQTGDGGFGGGGAAQWSPLTKYGDGGGLNYGGGGAMLLWPGGGGFGGGGGAAGYAVVSGGTIPNLTYTHMKGFPGQPGSHSTFIKTVPSAQATYTIVVGAGGDVSSASLSDTTTMVPGAGGQGIVIIKY